MKSERLYTLDSKGKVRIFEVEILTQGLIEVVTRTGLLDGKLVEKREIVSKGKQGRSVLEQAEFQATSLWNEKLDSGYKTLSALQNKLQNLGIVC